MCTIVFDVYYGPVVLESLLGFGVSSGEFRNICLAQDIGDPSKDSFLNNRLFRKPPLLGPPLSLPENLLVIIIIIIIIIILIIIMIIIIVIMFILLMITTPINVRYFFVLIIS